MNIVERLRSYRLAWGELPSISPHVREAPGFTTGKVIGDVLEAADEIERLTLALHRSDKSNLADNCSRFDIATEKIPDSRERKPMTCGKCRSAFASGYLNGAGEADMGLAAPTPEERTEYAYALFDDFQEELDTAEQNEDSEYQPINTTEEKSNL